MVDSLFWWATNLERFFFVNESSSQFISIIDLAMQNLS